MNILIIPGSVRPNSVNQTIVSYVQQSLASRDVTVTTATLDDITLPFYDAPTPPSADEFVATDQKVLAWTAKVAAADAFVFVVPEYNHSMSAIQKNAIDWVYQEWNDKPAAIVTYNWYDHKNAVDTFKSVASIVKLRLVDPIAGLKFGAELMPDGTILDETAIQSKIDTTIKGLLDV